MYRDHTISVVVPAYNEELLIIDTLSSIPDFVDTIYVVNDCSKDATQEKIDAYLPKDKRVVSLPHEVNKGVGAAIVISKFLHSPSSLKASYGEPRMELI